METADTESCIGFKEQRKSSESKTECTEDREHETIQEEPDSDDLEFDVEPTEPISLSTGNGFCEVSMTVNIALAIPNAQDDDSVTGMEKTKKKSKKSAPNTVVEAPKAQGYYHIEYNLLPHDHEPTKVDLVTFGLAAKLYKGNKSKVLKPWVEDDITWLTWSQIVRLKVTKEMLIKLVRHKVTFRVWDTKDFVSATAKHDRPKGFRLPADRSDGSAHSDARNMVFRMRNCFGKEGSKEKSLKQTRESIPYELRMLSDDINCATGKYCHCSCTVSCNAILVAFSWLTSNSILFFILSYLLTAEHKLSSTDVVANERAGSPIAITQEQQHTSTRNTIFKASLANSEYIRKNGAATAELSFIHLLAGEMSLTGHMDSRSKGVLEGMCNISLDKPLISGEMKTALNPLVITIHSATSLPSTPVPLFKLEQKCVPVYCQYKFYNMKNHKTKSFEHHSNIYFKDVNVIFTGLISQGELIEYLQGPPLEIEVHDRDKKGDRRPTPSDVYGRSAEDSLLSSVALINSKAITHNPFKSVKPRHPHGVARLSFAELLKGQRSLRYNLPICCSASPQILGQDKAQWEQKMLDVHSNSDEAEPDTMPVGHYLQSNSHLKVQVEIAYPLNAERNAATEGECPFGRIVFLMTYDNVEALTKLHAEILRVNLDAFQLKCPGEEAKQRALALYKVSAQEMESKELDFLTGFHLLDKNMHLFVIEGLKDGAVKGLWNMSLTKSDGIDKQQITTLYNSALSFSKRLYDCLDMTFCPIHLHEPLQAIMRRPLLYVRDMVPHACFQGLSRLSQLCQAQTMKDVLRNDLFPTGEMVLSLSKEFGSLPEKAQEIIKDICQSPTGDTKSLKGRVRPYPPIENYNQEYVEWKQLVAAQELCGDTKDFVQANIDEVQRASLKLNRPKPAVIVAEVQEGKTAHNYSTQALNTTEQAKDLLRKELAKAPSQRYMYSQEFLSGMFEPCTVESERKAAEARSREAWCSPNAFTYPGVRSSIESNEHPKMPDEARIEELRKPWRENILHGNTLGPTLCRTTWPWDRRSEDFQLYARPPPVFQPKPPVTIHLAGDLLRQEQLEAARAQYSRWLRKILPDKHNPDSRRVPQFKAHMKREGLDNLSGILRDKPRKCTLPKGRRFWKAPPAVSAPHGSEVTNEERQRKIQRIPQQSDGDGNIPHHSSQYNNNKSFR
ncbi:hypothetical protein ACEWY4_013002 [Coilia grayii]|uniref:DUF4550 domain-containing protein n=1 Tax=Coilia grayii TaxID=363190 RepID=A0ABD1JV61_9TELE